MFKFLKCLTYPNKPKKINFSKSYQIKILIVSLTLNLAECVFCFLNLINQIFCTFLPFSRQKNQIKPKIHIRKKARKKTANHNGIFSKCTIKKQQQQQKIKDFL